jgi:outer membrane protein TolC
MKKILILFIFHMSLCLPVFGQSLSVDQYLNLIIENDPAYKSLIYEAEKIKGQLESAESMFDWHVAGNISTGKVDEINQGAFTINDTQNVSFDLSLEKLIKQSGTMLSFGYGYEESKLSVMNTGIELYQPSLHINISQPLWQNQFGISNKIRIRAIELMLEIQEILYKEQQEQYFAGKLELYYNWIAASLSLEFTNNHYKNAIKLYKEMKAKYENDLINKTDLIRSEESVYSLEEMLANQLDIQKQMSRQIIQVTSHDIELDVNIENIAIDSEDYEIKADLDNKSEYRIDDIYKIRLAALDLDRQNIEEEDKTKLDAFFNYKLYENTVDAKYWNDYGKNDYSFGLKTKIDLEHKNYNGKSKENKAAVNKLNLEWQKTLQDLKTYSEILKSSINANKKSQERLNKILNLSSSRVEMELKRYSSGKVIFNNVITAQNDELTNQNNALKSKISGHSLIIKYLANEDLLLSKVWSLVKVIGVNNVK